MDRDVQSRLDRLCIKYAEASSRIDLLRPNRLPTRKAAKRIQNQILDVLGQLQEARKPIVAALVRLAYVRAMRASRPEARLGPDQQVEVDALTRQLNIRLGNLENESSTRFNDHLRRQVVRRISPELNDVLQDVKPFPLEHYARASIHGIVEQAMAAGSLAGTDSTSYDEAA